MNGDFVRAHGHGIEELDVREMCDVAYALHVADLERHYYALVSAGATWKDSKDPLGDAIMRFEEKIGLRDNPEDLALELHRKWLEQRGIEWDDTPVGAGNGQWWDQDVEFTDMADLDREAKRREAVSRNRGIFAREEA